MRRLRVLTLIMVFVLSLTPTVLASEVPLAADGHRGFIWSVVDRVEFFLGDVLSFFRLGSSGQSKATAAIDPDG